MLRRAGFADGRHRREFGRRAGMCMPDMMPSRCADRRRGPGRAHARDRSGVARDRRHGDRDARARRASRAKMQPCRGPHHGNLPAAWRGGKGPQCRAACGLSPRHQLPHDVYGRRTDANSNSLPPRPLHAEGWPGLQLADARAAASHQPDLPRADPVRACRRPAAHPHHQPDLGRRRRDSGGVRRRGLARSRDRGHQAA